MAALEESCKKWEYLPQMGQMSNPLLALIPLDSDSKEHRQDAIARAERALDILHFRSRGAFSNYLRLVAHHAEDGNGIGALIRPDFFSPAPCGPVQVGSSGDTRGLSARSLRRHCRKDRRQP